MSQPAPEDGPENSFVRVTFPARVVNEDRALEMLGGKPSIAKAARAPSTHPLQLRYKRDSQNSHPMQARVNDNPRELVVQVTKKPRMAASAEILGRVTRGFAFEGLSDFHSNLPSGSKIALDFCEEFALADHTERVGEQRFERTVFAPPLYSLYDDVHRYQFTESTIRDVDQSLATAVAGATKRVGVAYDVTTVPGVDDGVPIAKLRPSAQKLAKHLRKCFSERPIWTGQALNVHRHCDEITTDLLRALPCVAYRFGTGPWHECWIKLGYDPRLPENMTAAREHQAIRVRGVPDHLRLLQAWEIADLSAEAKHALSGINNELSANRNLHSTRGWFTRPEINTLRHCVKRLGGNTDEGASDVRIKRPDDSDEDEDEELYDEQVEPAADTRLTTGGIAAEMLHSMNDVDAFEIGDDDYDEDD